MEAGNALFYKRVVSGVVICNMGVMYRFVPLLLMFSFHKAKGRSGKICRFGYLVKKTRVFNVPEVQVDSVWPRALHPNFGGLATISTIRTNMGKYSLQHLGIENHLGMASSFYPKLGM